MDRLKMHGTEIMVAKPEAIQLKDYCILLGREYDKQYAAEVILLDSICVFYGVERSELVEIRQNKNLINKRKKLMNFL